MGKHIAVIGVGYVGLTTAALMARLGHKVRCADIDADRIATLSDGRIPIHERGLEDIVREHLASERLQFVLGAGNAVAGREFVFLCVGTPRQEDGSADLSHVEAAVREIAPRLDPGSIVIIKSTVPVGTAHVVQGWLNRADVSVVSNPEFLREGTAVQDSISPDRVVIGSDDPRASARVARLYSKVSAPILIADALSAETVKYAANAFLATKLSFANSVAALCEAVGANIDDVLLGVGYDHRIGHAFLKPGPGWGGACLPKDTHALLHIAEDAGYDFALLRGVVQAHEDQLDRVVDKIERAADGSLAGVRIGALGLAFKAGTDDVRESPAVKIITRLVEGGAIVRAYDPVVKALGLPGLEVVPDPYRACEEAVVVVLLTEWDEFKHLDLDRLASVVTRRTIVDARNHLDRASLLERGFSYDAIGRS